jgi:diphthamide biosynthesis protein 2
MRHHTFCPVCLKVHGYDPTTRQATLQALKTNKLLMRRYAVVQKARDADVFGILVGTLGVGSPPTCFFGY